MRVQILITLLLACGTAQASDWVSVVKSADGKTEAFVDRSSIRVAAGIRRAWIKLVYARHTMKGDGRSVGKWESSEVGRNAYNCNEEAEMLEALTTYYDDGTNYSAPSEALRASWRPVQPDTLASAEMHFVCT